MQTSGSSHVVVKAVEGDLKARDELFNECRPLLRLVIRGKFRQMFRSRFDESDVVQQTLLEANRCLPAFRGRSRAEFLAWLQTIVQRSLWSFAQVHLADKRDIRKEQCAGEGEGSLSIVWRRQPAAWRNPESLVVAGEQALQLARAMEKLPNNMRTVIEKRFLDGMKLREIAACTDLSVGQIAGLLRRGLLLLQEHLPSELKSTLRGAGDAR